MIVSENFYVLMFLGVLLVNFYVLLYLFIFLLMKILCFNCNH